MFAGSRQDLPDRLTRRSRESSTWVGISAGARIRAFSDNREVNEAFLDLLNGQLAGRWSVVDSQFVWWAQNGIFLLFGVAGARGLFELRRQPTRAVRILIAVIAGAAAAALLLVLASNLVSEARPFVADSHTIQLLRHRADNSFPSDHATIASLVAVTGSLAWPKFAPVFLSLAVLVGLARVLSGVHYPGDVVAGWAIGGLVAFGAWQLFQPNRQDWPGWTQLRGS